MKSGRSILLWLALLPLVFSFEEFGNFWEFFHHGDEFEESLKVVRENLDFYAAKGIEAARAEAKRIEMAKRNRPNTRDHHNRKDTSDLPERVQCFSRGMIATKDIILEQLKNSHSLPVEEVLRRVGPLSDRTCFEMARACNVEDQLIKQRTPCTSTAKYRTYDGSCNNILPNNQTVGKAGVNFRRVLHADYRDSKCSVRTDLPSARFISSVLNEGKPVNDQTVFDMTVMVMQWGQFLDHDIAKTREIAGVQECCHNFVYQPGLQNDDCIPIVIPANDPFYGQFSNINCLPLHRAESGTVNCNPSAYVYRNQINDATAYIDGSQIYGNSEQEVRSLREPNSPRMLTSSDREDSLESCTIDSKYTIYLPAALDNSPTAIFRAGDFRVNEQPGLTSLHTVFVRYHNALADALRANPKYASLTDDEIFEEARKFVIAVLQHITYNEFLPALFPQRILEFFKLHLTNAVPVYDPLKSAELFNEFATAAYRFGHSLIPFQIGINELSKSFFKSISVKNSPDTTITDTVRDECGKTSPEFDEFVSDSVNGKLFQETGNLFGEDLFSRNIQRGRDHGLPSLNSYRRKLGLPAIDSSNIDLLMRKGAGAKLRRAYNNNFENIELFPGGLSEAPLSSDTMFGPTLAMINGVQFNYLRFGDKFWYEIILTHDELQAVKSTRFADVLCESTCLNEVQNNVFRKPTGNTGSNPIISCAARRTNGVTTILDHAKK